LENSPPVPLSSLRSGQSACIRSILGRREHVHRLNEFGLRNGTEIEVFRAGSPCILRLEGNKFCLRADELLNVLVEPLARP
jgi:ferrous iron transport protein A